VDETPEPYVTPPTTSVVIRESPAGGGTVAYDPPRSDVRKCTWTICDEPAIDGSPYCAKHADAVSPANLRALMERERVLRMPKAQWRAAELRRTSRRKKR
jgi:hypothetical protein